MYIATKNHGKMSFGYVFGYVIVLFGYVFGYVIVLFGYVFGYVFGYMIEVF